MLLVHMKDELVGSFDGIRTHILSLRRQSGKFPTAKAYLWRIKWLAYRVLSGGDKNSRNGPKLLVAFWLSALECKTAAF
jgi:hypothetical protein